MLPNGTFYLGNESAGAMETRAFLRRNQRPNYATQSGPMLVIRNRIHPLFKPSSSFKKRRNAVGVSRDGRRVYFVISENSVIFYSLAKFFLNKLRTPNALYLDGGHVPQMVTNKFSISSFSPVGP
ncbi:MAG: phosphodiester glycosidase family protein, partial [Desulfobulbia bacterium]